MKDPWYYFMLYLLLFGLVGAVVQASTTNVVQAFGVSMFLCANVVIWLSILRRKLK